MALFFEFVGILREACKIFPHNGKLMFSITLLTLFLNSLLYLFNFFSITPLIKNLRIDEKLLLVTPSTSPEYGNLLIKLSKDFEFFCGIEWINLLVTFIAAIFLATTTILASTVIHARKYITFKDLFLKAMKSWKKPFITCLYTTLFEIGYLIIFLAILYPLVLDFILQRLLLAAAAFIVVAVVAWLFYFYLAVAWTLALVISVTEDVYGLEALGKAAKIVKGSKLRGFFLNLLLAILSFLVQCIGLIGKQNSRATPIIIGVVVANLFSLLKMFWLMAYTILYCQCKKNHGEKVEVLESTVEYTRVPQLDETIP